MNDASPFIFPTITEPLVEALTALMFNGEEAEAAVMVDHLMAGGVSPESIMLDLLAPSARMMGDLWCDDRRDFVEVTLGLARLQHLVRQFRLAPGDAAPIRGEALLLAVPGEQHTFGVRLVEEHLLRAGWRVTATLKASQDEIGRRVSADYYDFVGFSVTSDRLLPALRSAIRSVRTYSRNRDIRIVVGGVLFAGHDYDTRDIDADAIVTDARQAVLQAEAWRGLARLE